MSTPPYQTDGTVITGVFAGPPQSPPLKRRGGGGTSDGMNTRITRLETHMEYVQRDLAELKAGQGKILGKLDRLTELPTKRDLDTWRWQWIAAGVAIIALTVGGITGGLALIAQADKPTPSVQPVAPVIAQPAAPAPAATTVTPDGAKPG